MTLEDLGYDAFFAGHFSRLTPQLFAGRVAAEQKNLYRVLMENDEVLAQISGKFRFSVTNRTDLPAVGDWVALSMDQGLAQIQAVMPRKSKFSRKVSGNVTEEQIVAANVDTVFLVNALNHDFNLRRLERYLTLAWESGANPVIVLSKSDLCVDVESKHREVEGIAPGVPVIATSCTTGEGLALLDVYMRPGQTVALLGSSGVGKSTLLNRIYGADLHKTSEVRQGDQRGRHTTTNRELVLLPGRGMLIDTPGMRELQLWGTESGLAEAFADIELLARLCRYSDCSHQHEPGCAVQQALSDGTLNQERYASFQKLKRELDYLARKENQRALLEEKAKWKRINKTLKQQYKHR